MFQVLKSKQVRQYFIELQKVQDRPESKPSYDVLVDFGQDALGLSKYGFKDAKEAERYFESFKDRGRVAVRNA